LGSERKPLNILGPFGKKKEKIFQVQWEEGNKLSFSIKEMEECQEARGKKASI